jgi:hypothetical protein
MACWNCVQLRLGVRYGLYTRPRRHVVSKFVSDWRVHRSRTSLDLQTTVVIVGGPWPLQNLWLSAILISQDCLPFRSYNVLFFEASQLASCHGASNLRRLGS